jgi:hypothetical protein
LTAKARNDKENCINFQLVKKKILANLQRIKELSTQKLTLSSQKYRSGIWDPRSGKNLFRIPGSKKAPDPGSATLLTTEKNMERCQRQK